MGGWNLRKNYSRKPATIRLQKRFLIMTEGKTEETYFNHYRQLPNPIVQAIDGTLSKKSLVEKAIEVRNQKIASKDFIEDLDEAWVVFDRDVDPSKTSDKANFNDALTLAASNNIEVAYSNDSFELWLLLHYQVVSSGLHRDVIDTKLQTRIGKKYIHGKTDIFDEIKGNRDTAIKRATQMLIAQNGVSPEAANPSTTIHILVQRIMSEPGFRNE